MHSFEHLLTGSEVKFDGVSTSFLITRHRSVVGLHKKVEATAARIQVLNNGHTVQLVVFFEDLAGGYCMSVVLWGTDVYEAAYDKSKHYVRFSDAKFSLPRTKDERDSEFVCLDTQEFAGEHGDIMIGFESEEGELNRMRHEGYTGSANTYFRRTRRVRTRIACRDEESVTSGTV